MTWRSHCAPIIRKVLLENIGKPEKQIKKALRDAYPYGQREMHPYKIWCDEIHKQRRTKTPQKIEKIKEEDKKHPKLF